MENSAILNAAFYIFAKIQDGGQNSEKNSIRYPLTPKPRELLLDTMRYRRNETVQNSGDFPSK